MRSGLDTKDLILIDAGDPALRWEAGGKEFYLHGELYDVVKQEMIHGKTMLCCINDAKEEELVKKMLKDTQSQTGQQGNKDGKHSYKTVIQDFTLPSDAALSIPLCNNREQQVFFAYSLIKTIKKVNTPPPNFLKS